jgi:transposase
VKDLVSEYLDRSKLPYEVEPLKDIIGVLSQALLKLWEEVDTLKAENAALREENAALRAENAELRAANAKLRQENAVLKADNEILRSEIAVLKHKIFGKGKGRGKTEEKKTSVELVAGGSNRQADSPAGGQNKQKNHQKNHPGRSPLRPDLPRERLVYDIETAQKICPKCQGFLSLIGEEISEQLEWVRASLKVLEQVRLKYGCRKCSQTIITAPTPYKPIEKGLAGPNLMAHVVVSKFCDHLPLYRQEQIFKRYGVSLRRSTLCR